jgi:hypothetical protein
MLSLAVWWVGISVELLLLVRSIQLKMLKTYWLFYLYIASVLAFSVSAFGVLVLRHSWFQSWYWAGQFLTLIVGYGVMLEILRQVLEPYAGAERFGTFVVSAVFIGVFGFVILRSFVSSWSPSSASLELERDLRIVQVLILMGILSFVSYYRIPMGRNLKGITLGYGLYVAASLMSLAARAYKGTSFEAAWNVIQPFSWDLCLCVWAAALWSYYPNPAPQSARLEEDYETLALRTRAMLGSMRSILVRSARP